MLVALQFPFTDARSFVQRATYRLATPSWSILNVERDFIRSVGPIRERRKRSVQEWPEEGAYCRISRAIRFDPSYQQIEDPDLAGFALRRYCAFRRFMAGGILKKEEGTEVRSIAARMEFGFGVRSRAGYFELSPDQCAAFVNSILKLPVTFRGATHTVPLLGVRDLFDDLYLRSTTKHGRNHQRATENWWFRRGSPLALVEFFTSGSLNGLPPSASRVPALAERGIQLAYHRIEPEKNLRIGLWLIGVQPNGKDYDLLRRLRINLFRLHAEREGIAEVLRLILQDKLKIVRGTRPSEDLQAYLDAAVRFLNRSTRDCLPQSDILSASEEAEDFAQPGQREELLARIDQIRGNLFRNVEAYVRTKQPISAVKNKIFISYSHEDEDWKKALEKFLKPYVRSASVTAWSDKQIGPGSKWFDEIKGALAESSIVLMLVTPNFLASDFINEHELGPALEQAETGGLKILWVPVRFSAYTETALQKYQAVIPPDKPLAEMKGSERDKAWLRICEEIKKVTA
jgi:hypothetical protein